MPGDVSRVAVSVVEVVGADVPPWADATKVKFLYRKEACVGLQHGKLACAEGSLFDVHNGVCDVASELVVELWHSSYARKTLKYGKGCKASCWRLAAVKV